MQGQIYHRAGSLLPVSDSNYKFLQIYFMGNSPKEIDLRCAHNNLVKRSIVEQLQTLFHEHNQLIILFKTALDLMSSDNYKIEIGADKTPAGQHARRFNAPTIDEVAIVVVGENLESRNIVLHRQNDRLQRIKETRRSYDALQYPIIFWQGEDGYDFSIKMINPVTGSETNKKVSSMNYYSYRLMILENHILKCRRSYHKYVVDMYVKIEMEILIFIRLNQTKLQSEEYIHFRDAINTDENAQNVGRMTILPATYIGSPRNMHEYAQDTMSYVRHYGTADLFITFTCNPHWIEIKQKLFPGQSLIDRHDITARVFRQKLKSLMDFIVKHYVFGGTRHWMYSVEWQKRGLPHAHILIWLVEKIRPNEVNAVISAEIPYVQVDPGLHEIVIKNMIHDPCGSLNQNSPCMMDGKCLKRYPRILISETITDVARNYRNHDRLSERAILAAKNIDVNELNFKIQEQITGESRIYKSVDSATNQDDVVNYPPEFLNSLDLPGLPPHNLQLKVGSVVIMLRNINQPRLCNGTWLAIKKLLNNVIEATILKGKYKGEYVLIPCIPMIPTDVPFEFKRLQFPVRLAFAMTINKSQGQSLSVCGINLENPCFSHGQLYVACCLFVYAPEVKALFSNKKKKNLLNNEPTVQQKHFNVFSFIIL
ncbi:hypothetical protein QTP88_001621 [Uroleucon formosanum]